MTTRPTAAEYATTHNLNKMLSEAANQCYAANAPNPEMFLASYFRKSNAVDVIDQVEATEVMDGCGGCALRIEVTLANGISATATTSHSNALTSTNPTTSRTAIFAGDKDSENTRYGQFGLRGAEQMVNDKLSAALVGAQASNQQKIDSILQSVDGTENFANIGSQVAATVSAAVAACAAKSERQPLFVKIAKDAFAATVLPKALHIPTPVVTLFSTEPKNMGKLRIQSVCIIPSMSNGIEEAVPKCSKVVEAAVAKISEGGDVPVVVSADGGIRYSGFESLQQVVDLVGDCVKDAGFSLGEDFTVGIVFDSAYCYKPETQKYNLVEGQEFSGGQVAEFIATFIKEKPGLVSYVEDTHVTADVSECRRLMSRIGDTVAIAGNNLYSSNAAALRSGVENKMTTNAVIRINDCGTVSTALTNSRIFAAYPNATSTVAAEVCEGNAEFVADFGVGIAARFIRTGGLLRPDHANIINRLLVIRKEAEARGLYGAAPQYEAPELPPAPAEAVVEVNLEKGKKGKK